jgi:hypothetical protein
VKVIPVTIVRLLTDGEAVALCKANLSTSSFLFAAGDTASRVTQNFTLPTAQSDCSVTWSATSSAWITGLDNSSGLVSILRDYSASDETVVFTATLSRNLYQGASDTKDISVTIARLLGNTEVDACANAIGVGTLSFTSPDTAAGVTQNFSLPSELSVNGAVCSLVWEENPDTSFLQINGTAVTVNRPTYSSGNAIATLRATVSGGTAYTKQSSNVSLTVSRLPATDQEKADECRNLFAASNISFSSPDSATSVTKNFTLPATLVVGGFSCLFSAWQSDSSAIVLSGTEQRSATVSRPADDELDSTVLLSGTVSFNGTVASSLASATVTVKKYTEAESVAACKASLTTSDFTGINTPPTSATAATVPVSSSAITFPTAKTGVGGKNCTLSWVSNKTSYIAVSSGSGAVTHEYDAADTYVTLTPTITRGSSSDASKTFSMRVKSLFTGPNVRSTLVQQNQHVSTSLSINFVASNVTDGSTIVYKICYSLNSSDVGTIPSMDSVAATCQTTTTAFDDLSFPLVIEVNGQPADVWYVNVYSMVQGQPNTNSKKILYDRGSAIFQ